MLPVPALDLPVGQGWHWSSEVSPLSADHLPWEQRPWHWASAVSPVEADHLPREQRPWHWASSVSPVEADHLPGEQPWHGVVRINTFLKQPFTAYVFPDVLGSPLPQPPPAEEP